jgi:hypothetical protein
VFVILQDGKTATTLAITDHMKALLRAPNGPDELVNACRSGNAALVKDLLCLALPGDLTYETKEVRDSYYECTRWLLFSFTHWSSMYADWLHACHAVAGALHGSHRCGASGQHGGGAPADRARGTGEPARVICTSLLVSVGPSCY